MLCLLVLLSPLLAHGHEEQHLTYAWDSRFTETPAPASPVRAIAEFEPATQVIVRYPLGIPVSLVALLANTAELVCLVNSSSAITTASNAFNNAGVNMQKVSFLVAATDSYWTRDYSPWFIFDASGELGVVDFRYNRPRPGDDNVPRIFATAYELPYYGMNLYQTGGNYMCDGINTAAQTDIAYSENSNNQSNVNAKMLAYLGISNYHVLPDPNNTYIDHIDCWGKFLAPDKILIRSVAANHPQYNALENTAAYFAAQNCAWGYPYQVYRVYTPNNQPYSNSLILNKKVFVPQMNSSHDNAALQVYRDAMPGYEVIGIMGAGSTPWESTDALHCRTHEVPDAQMLHIAHQPYYGQQAWQESFHFTADITAHSAAPLYADSLYIRYSINSGDWQYLGLSSTGAMHYSASLNQLSSGDNIRYYIHAADSSGRHQDHPIFAALDPHRFVIQGDNDAPQISHTAIESIGAEAITFMLTAQDASGIARAELTYKIDSAELHSVEMISAGNGLYLYLYEPDFAPQAQYLHYRVSATDNFGNSAYLPASDTWYSASILPTSNADLQILPAVPTLTVYPNPARQTDQIRIQLSSPKREPWLIEVYNLRGQLIYSDKQPASTDILNWRAVDMNGQSLSSGLYFLRFRQADLVLNHKLIIAH